MSLAALQFDPGPHTYHYDGRLVPSVTQILEAICDNFSAADPGRLALAQARGTAVHTATELHDLDILDREDLDPALAGYLESWIHFVSVYQFEPSLIEQQVYHPTYRYAGALDRVGKLIWNRRRRTALIDIKSGVPMDVTAIQTAGYELALPKSMPNAPTPSIRLGVYLNKDGKLPHVTEYRDPGDQGTFLAFRRTYQWLYERN